MQIASLHRYPVKGLSPERVQSFDLVASAYVPGDRLFAIENGPSGFDPADPRHQPKIKFLQLMRNERLARLSTRFDDGTTTLSITGDGDGVTADLSQEPGREAVRAFFQRLMPEELRGLPRVLAAPAGFRFTDSRSGYVSILNAESVSALEAASGWSVDPMRFRANLLVTGIPAWSEFDLVGMRLVGPSGVVLEVTKRIVRCAAVNVDPGTGARDMELPRLLAERFGHLDCGVYAQVVRPGSIAEGDKLLAEQASLPLDRDPSP